MFRYFPGISVRHSFAIFCLSTSSRQVYGPTQTVQAQALRVPSALVATKALRNGCGTDEEIPKDQTVTWRNKGTLNKKNWKREFQ
jgi:hypothetical protein